MKNIKIRKDIGDLIVSGEKTLEFRKVSKGLTSGKYQFVSIKQKCPICGPIDDDEIDPNGKFTHDGPTHNADCIEIGPDAFTGARIVPEEVYGYANLKIIDVNNKPHINTLDESNDENYKKTMKDYVGKEIYNAKYTLGFFDEPDSEIVDSKTYHFVKDNYIKQNIEFLVYRISNVEVKGKLNYGYKKS